MSSSPDPLDILMGVASPGETSWGYPKVNGKLEGGTCDYCRRIHRSKLAFMEASVDTLAASHAADGAKLQQWR